MKMTLILKLVLRQNLCYACLFINMVITVKCQYDEYIKVDERPMPPEIIAKNKTDYEVEMENCMDEYIHCLHNILSNNYRIKQICAVTNHGNKDTRDFENLCDMIYETCKPDINNNGEIRWSYLHDGPCEQRMRRTVLVFTE